MSLEHVLVMGGSSGIGAATAELFARRGAEVVITGRDQDKLTRTAQRIDGKVITRRLDAASTEEVAAFFAAEDHYDHMVLALSGGSGGGPFATLDLAALRNGFEAKFWLPECPLVHRALARW